MIPTIELPNGHVVELYEPRSSGVEPCRAGTCPGCGEQLEGFRGRYAAVRELAGDGLPVTGGGYTTSYGHLTCVQLLFDEITARPDGDANPGGVWQRGRQRDAIEFLHRHRDHLVEVRFNDEWPRDERYHYRLRGDL